MNPLDLLLGALATCGTFVCETAAREFPYDLTDAVVDVDTDFDPQGVKGIEGVVCGVLVDYLGANDPRIARVRNLVPG